MSSAERRRMVERQLVSRGISEPRLLEAFLAVPREHFLPENLRPFAYEDAPLPIALGQTISQPYIVALMADALGLTGTERVLEIGTGSGYAAAVLARLAKEVFTVERHRELAETARASLARLGCENVRVLHGDGSLGWPEHAPYQAISVAAGGPEVPKALLSQLAPGGRLVIPVGPESHQMLIRVTREEGGDPPFRYEELTPVRFVPLIGEQGFSEPEGPLWTPSRSDTESSLSKLVRENAEPIPDIESAELGALLDRIADAKLVLLGEATHGTSEFYRMRARITRELISRRGFDFVAVEADWPDAQRVDSYVLGDPVQGGPEFTPFSRFPTWMWRNEEVHEFVEWLRAYNAERERTQRVGFHGLDLYSMFTSIAVVLDYLTAVDPEAARSARSRYGTLNPFQRNPIAYGRDVIAGRYQSSEPAVVATLESLLARRMEYSELDGERFFNAVQNAQLVADAERYYRAMYHGAVESWNLRDTHMFETLRALLEFYGPESKGVVWAHNSHVGNARATEMSRRGEHNIGQLCRDTFGARAYIVGFSTDHGSVAAASDWDEPMELMRVRPALPESYEHLFHTSGVPAFTLYLRSPRSEVRDELAPARLERAIGVIYRPETERQSHYFSANLPDQFDELIWFDETRAVTALDHPSVNTTELPDTYPFGM